MSSTNLLDNYTRGLVAEAIVATACGGKLVGQGYGSWDVHLEPTRIEVKASGWLQSWPQRRHSTPVFSIAPASGWFEDENQMSVADPQRMRRSSDVYVF